MMRIATFNANSIRTRLPIILDWLSTHRPDVLAIQETKVVDADFPAQPLQDAGYHVAFRGEKSYNGVAVLSLKPPSEVRFGIDDGGPADETRLAWARFGSLNIVNTYVPQGREIDHPMFAYKIEWLGRLRRYFERHFTPRREVIWLGDMNVAPESIDLHNPQENANHVCFHESVRQAFAWTAAWGLDDCFRRHHPEPGQYTFFDYRTVNAVKRGMGWRVDHILATAPLASTCTASWIDLAPRLKARSSDHTFLVADFE